MLCLSRLTEKIWTKHEPTVILSSWVHLLHFTTFILFLENCKTNVEKDMTGVSSSHSLFDHHQNIFYVGFQDVNTADILLSETKCCKFLKRDWWSCQSLLILIIIGWSLSIKMHSSLNFKEVLVSRKWVWFVF